MPTEDRKSISHIKPSGWKSAKYDHVDGKYLYNRSHLIGFQLTGENDNEKNLITGTRYMNVDGMLPFENQVDDYVDATGHHVMLRVTPIFDGNNLVASGVQMEAQSVEDDALSFNVYCYNVQPGVEIDYATGNSKQVSQDQGTSQGQKESLVLNTKGKKIHRPTCASVDQMDKKNKKEVKDDPELWLTQGYSWCNNCK